MLPNGNWRVPRGGYTKTSSESHNQVKPIGYASRIISISSQPRSQDNGRESRRPACFDSPGLRMSLPPLCIKECHLNTKAVPGFALILRRRIKYKNPQLTEVSKHHTRKVRPEEQAAKQRERSKRSKMATNGPEDCGEASSRHSRPRSETSRLREDRADSSTPPGSPADPPPASLQAFKCWQDNVTDSEVEEFVYGEAPYRQNK